MKHELSCNYQCEMDSNNGFGWWDKENPPLPPSAICLTTLTSVEAGGPSLPNAAFRLNPFRLCCSNPRIERLNNRARGCQRLERDERLAQSASNSLVKQGNDNVKPLCLKRSDRPTANRSRASARRPRGAMPSLRSLPPANRSQYMYSTSTKL